MTEEPTIKEDDIEQPPEYEFNIDDIKEVKHNWVKRGIKVNCEGAGHPYHGHFLVNRK